jgi:hypothetical protein
LEQTFRPQEHMNGRLPSRPHTMQRPRFLLPNFMAATQRMLGIGT